MPSELKRGAIRVGSNYARLFAGLLLGIIFVPIFMMGVGDDAFGLLALFGSTIGIAEMCNAIVRDSMNRELGAAYHSEDQEEFPTTYNSALVLTTILAGVTTVLFACIYALLPLFNIPDELIGSARWLLVMNGVLSVLTVLLGAPFNMYMVTERMVIVNIWKVANRAVDLIAAVTLFVFMGMRDPAAGLIGFALLSPGGRILVLLVAVAWIVSLEQGLIPRISKVRTAVIKRVFSTAGWNSAAVIATNLHMRVDNIIMNLAFGLMHNAAFGLALRLTSYVRMLAFASTFGLDVVSARISTKQSYDRVVDMMHHATRLHAMVAFPAAMIVVFLASPLLHLWVGRTAEHPETITMAIVLSQILVIGMTARGISDCWTRMLYGAGFVRAYAPLVLVGGVLNPIIAVTLIFLLPEAINYTGPAIAFAGILVTLHFLIIPVITARCFSITPGDVMRPIVRPAILTAFTAPILLLPRVLDMRQSPIALVAAVLLFGGATYGLAWIFVLTSSDRERLKKAISRRFGKGTSPARRNTSEAAAPADPSSGHV